MLNVSCKPIASTRFLSILLQSSTTLLKLLHYHQFIPCPLWIKYHGFSFSKAKENIRFLLKTPLLLPLWRTKELIWPPMNEFPLICKFHSHQLSRELIQLSYWKHIEHLSEIPYDSIACKKINHSWNTFELIPFEWHGWNWHIFDPIHLRKLRS